MVLMSLLSAAARVSVIERGRRWQWLAVTERIVKSQMASIFTEPGLGESPGGHRRVLMVRHCLGAGS